MTAPTVSPLFARTQGSGVSVVCLHSSTGSHGQWRGLMDTLADRCQVTGVDLHGHGRSPAFPASRLDSLHLDTQAVLALARAGSPDGVHLVAHSYGAAVALQIALRHPHWVRSLTLYEPVAFGLLHALAPGDAALGEIEEIAHSVEALVRAGELEGAARAFVGYWGGAAAWEAMSPAQRSGVAGRIACIPGHFHALFRARWPASLLARLAMPTLLMHGERTRAPARRVAGLLAVAVPGLRTAQVAGAGHLGPMTHEVVVNAAIVGHLAMCMPRHAAFA